MRKMSCFRMLGLSVLIVSTSFVANAQTTSRGWRVHADYVNIDPDLSFDTASEDGDPIHVSAGSDSGYGVGVEYRFARNAGVELQWVSGSPDVSLSADVDGIPFEVRSATSLSFDAVMLSLNIHLTPDSFVDVYVTPKLALVSYGDPTFSIELSDVLVDTLQLEVDSDIAWGFGAALDVPLGDSGWFVSGSVSYLDTTADFSERGDSDTVKIDFNPLLVGIGVGYRF